MYNVYSEDRMTDLDLPTEEISDEQYQKKNNMPTMASFIRRRPWHSIITMEQTSIQWCHRQINNCSCLCCQVRNLLYRWRRLNDFKAKQRNISINIPIERM